MVYHDKPVLDARVAGRPAPKDPEDPPSHSKHAFKHSPADLVKLNEGMDASALDAQFGGSASLITALGSSKLRGLTPSRVAASASFYGANRIQERKSKSFFRLVMESLKDLTMIILLVSAIVSIIISSIPQIATEKYGWIDGVAILVAVIIVSLVAATNDYSKEKQFRKLNAVKNDKLVKLVRAGKELTASIHDVVVGDVVVLELGDQIPADGVLFASNDMKVDESGMTGESDAVAKDEARAPFVIGSTLITHGSGSMVVTAVGMHSKYGMILSTLQEEETETPLQVKLRGTAKIISYIGISSAILTILTLVIKFFVMGKQADPRNYTEWVKYLILGITIIAVAVPEGLPLAVTISLAYSMKRMIKDQCLVRKLQACETMGSVSNICTDKTGTLTLNQMTVVRMRVGDTKYSAKPTVEEQTTVMRLPSKEHAINGVVGDFFALNAAVNSTAMLETRKVAVLGKRGGAGGASGAGGAGEKTATTVVGSKTEGALLMLAAEMGYRHTAIRESLVVGERKKGALPYVFEFTSDRKRMTSVVDLQAFAPNCAAHGGLLSGAFATLDDAANNYLALTKGASEIVLERCTRILLDDGSVVPLTDAHRERFNDTILSYAKQSLRTLCLAYREIPRDVGDRIVSADEISVLQHNEVTYPQYKQETFTETDLTLVCLVGIQDPLRPGVTGAIRRCRGAGVTVRMVTGDNLLTAIAIAQECGIIDRRAVEADMKRLSLSEDEAIARYSVTGPDFRALDDDEVDALLPTLRIIARASPMDKYRLVKRLRHHNKVVASTGDGSNDAPQLKAADVGLAMGIAGTEVAKEASDIIIMDDNFLSTVRAIEWGRTVMANIRKFIQFQLTVNVGALVIAFLGAAVLDESPLTAIQLLYVNLIMDSLGSLALATEAPTSDVLESTPVHRFASLITPGMTRNILTSALYQVAILLLFMFPGIGDALAFVPDGLFEGTYEGMPIDTSRLEHLRQIYRYTCIYNFFIFAQIFNEFNSRRIRSEKNVFAGIRRSPMFLGVIAGTIAMQMLIMFCPGIRFVFNIFDCAGVGCNIGLDPDTPTMLFKQYGIGWESWLITVVLAALSLPYHFAWRLWKLPDEYKVDEKKLRARQLRAEAKKRRAKKAVKLDDEEGSNLE